MFPTHVRTNSGHDAVQKLMNEFADVDASRKGGKGDVELTYEQFNMNTNARVRVRVGYGCSVWEALCCVRRTGRGVRVERLRLGLILRVRVRIRVRVRPS